MFFFFQAEDGIRYLTVTGVQTCALPISRARAELVEFRDVLQELERNPLPASIEVKLKPKFRDAEHVNDVADRLRGFGFVDDVRFGRDWVEKLDRLRQIAAAVGLVVGAELEIGRAHV